jgi:polyisoprenyl-phosphate glycosyltransferase
MSAISNNLYFRLGIHMYSLIIPVYKNEESIPELLEALDWLNDKLRGRLEVIFVVDGSPDNSHRILYEALPHRTISSVLIEHSRNFGSFAAARTGLSAASGNYFAIMAADLQEPPSLILQLFDSIVNDGVDVAIGTRRKRGDPFFSQLASRAYWTLYRCFVQREMPSGGVDVFACNLDFRNNILCLSESNSSLVGQIFWLGFRRKLVPYDRLKRTHGVSAWSFDKKIRYLMDSVFSFTDLPIRLLVALGIIGFLFFISFGTAAFVFKLTGMVEVPGYTSTVLIISFFAALNSLGLGVIGSYVWRAFENTKRRPLSIVRSQFNKGELQ